MTLVTEIISREGTLQLTGGVLNNELISYTYKLNVLYEIVCDICNDVGRNVIVSRSDSELCFESNREYSRKNMIH